MANGVQVIGERIVLANVKRRVNECFQRLIAETYVVTETVFDESQRLVPVKTGALKATGDWGVIVSGKEAAGTIHYGNEETDYAVAVHEKLNVKHPNGQAKYLEAAVTKFIPEIRSGYIAAARRWGHDAR